MPSPRYIKVADLVNEIPDNIQALLTDDGTTLSKNDSILKEKIATAEQVFESYVSPRYELPIEHPDGTVPNTVRQVVMTIAKYYLYGRRDAINQAIQEQYNAVMKYLADVHSGRANIPLIDSSGTVTDEQEVGSGSLETSDTGDQTQFNKFV